jgi:DNA-binding response OmpR family regulator
MKVLVVDDESEITEVVNLCFGLRWPDADVESAGDAEAGLKLIEQDPPDLVLLDINLPGMDGFEACQEIRRICDVPIVMVSARDNEVDKSAAWRWAPTTTSKPFSHLELVRVRAVLRRYQNQPRPSARCSNQAICEGLCQPLRHGLRWPVRLTLPVLPPLPPHPQRWPRPPHHTLLAKVWGASTPTDRLLKVYIRRLRQARGDPDTVAVSSASAVGYKFVGA